STGSSAPGRSSRSAGGYGAPCPAPVSGRWSPPQRRPDLSGRPVLGERGQLELVCRGAPVLIGEEEDGVGDPVRVGKGFRRDTRQARRIALTELHMTGQKRTSL